MLCKNKHPSYTTYSMDKKPSKHYVEKPVFEENFYIILLHPKTVLLLKEFIVKYSPFIHNTLTKWSK